MAKRHYLSKKVPSCLFDWVLNTPLSFLTHPKQNIQRFVDIPLKQVFQGKP